MQAGENLQRGPARVAEPKRADRARRWKRRAIAYPLLYLMWCGVLHQMQDRIIFPRHYANERAGQGPPRSDIESLWIETGDGLRVEGWFLRGAGASAERPGPAVIYWHGNAELIDDCVDRADMYSIAGFSVLLPEYRGYGRSGGEPSQTAITSDMQKFYDWLCARPEVDAQRLVFHGRSLGGGVAAALTERRTPAALILESTFSSLASMCWRYGVPEFLCRHPFRTDRALSRFPGPVLILHGRDDDIIPVAHGRKLHERIRGSAYVEMEAAHNDFPRDPEAYWQAIQSFLSEQRLWPRSGSPL